MAVETKFPKSFLLNDRLVGTEGVKVTDPKSFDGYDAKTPVPEIEYMSPMVKVVAVVMEFPGLIEPPAKSIN